MRVEQNVFCANYLCQRKSSQIGEFYVMLKKIYVRKLKMFCKTFILKALVISCVKSYIQYCIELGCDMAYIFNIVTCNNQDLIYEDELFTH